ncbi:MAG TPA: aromatic ring-hydroxylating dioxygenase subunit alpha [Pseudomonadales bacterium]
MKLDVQHALIERFVRHRQQGTTDMAPHSLRVPASHYTDPAQTAREIDIWFRQSPLLVALTPELPEPGSYVTVEAAGTSLLLVRDDHRRARAFINACRHRGARIAEGRGQARTFSCPFHAWNWARDGRLISRPNSCGGFDDAGDAFSHLLEVESLETAGMIFVLLRGSGIDVKVRHLLGDALDEIARYGIENTVYFGSRSTERACNYKLIMDGFTESYHIAALHKRTINPYYYTHPGLTDAFGPTVRMIGVRSSIDRELEKPAADQRLLPHGTTQYLIPPNVVLTHQVDHIQFWQMYPIDGAPDRCSIHFSLYWPAPMDEEAERKSQFNIDVIWNVTTEEDFPQSLAIQRNLASGAVPELVFGRNEPALIHYHQQIAAAMGSRELKPCSPDARADG